MTGLVNVYLGFYERGWTEIGDLASENANGRSEALLNVGGIHRPETVELIIDRLVAVSGQTYVASIIGIEPAGSAQQPYVSFNTYDTVSARQPDGTVGPVQVQAISATTDLHAHPIWTLECEGLAYERDQEVRTWLRRGMPGFVAGRTETANPARPASPLESSQVQAKKWTVSKDAGTDVLKSHEDHLKTPAHLCLWEVTLSSPNDGETWAEFGGYDDDVTVILVVSGGTVASVTVPAGDQSAWVGIAADYVSLADKIWADITAGPTNVALVGTARYI